jgi:hypothetical protein
MSFFTGSPEKFTQNPLLGPEQMPLLRQLLASLQGKGAGGAFGDTADYYRDILGNDQNSTFGALQAPEIRQFNEQTIPGIAEQFAGMGSGNLSSSGFRNAAVGAGADLGERLAAIRANLRGSAAQGLSQLGQQGLGQYYENQIEPAKPGIFDTLSQGIGSALPGIGSLLGPAGSALGAGLGGLASSLFSGNGPKKGSTGPYGQNRQSASMGALSGGLR